MPDGEEPVRAEVPRHLFFIKCSECSESWFVRILQDGHPDFLPRFCCYCGMRFTRTLDGREISQ